MADWVQVIVTIGVIVSSIAGMLAAFFAAHAAYLDKKNHERITEAHNDIKEIKVRINGPLERLLKKLEET